MDWKWRVHTNTKWKVSDCLSVSLEIMETGILVLSNRISLSGQWLKTQLYSCLSSLSRKQMFRASHGCCKIGKDWAHFRDFPIVAEQGNEAGNRIFCAKKTWISSYLCHKIFTAPSKCRSVSVFMTKSIIGDIIFIIYCQTRAGGLSIDGCKVNISNSGRAGLCQVIHQLEPSNMIKSIRFSSSKILRKDISFDTEFSIVSLSLVC